MGGKKRKSMRGKVARDKTDEIRGGSDYVKYMAMLKKKLSLIIKGNGKYIAFFKGSEKQMNSKCKRNLRMT